VLLIGAVTAALHQLRYLAEDACTGYGEASYRLVEAVRACGIEVEYRAFHEATPEVPAHTNRYRRDQQPRCNVPAGSTTIAHLVPEHYRAVRDLVGDGPLIGHTVWETDMVPAHWPSRINRIDAVIVPCEWNREVFKAGGVTVPIHVVPHIACDPVPGDRGAALDLPDDVVVFYSIARWDPRKAPWLAVQAFLNAFSGDDPVALVLKTTPTLQAAPLGDWGAGTTAYGTTFLEVVRLVRQHPNPPRIRLEVDDLPDDRVAGLHERGDCYVSLARGEGWGLGAFDACAYGNPVVTTCWGGQLSYLDAESAWLVDYDLVPVRHHWPRSYSPDQRWAEPSIEHAAAILREIAANLTRARRRAAPMRTRVLEEYAPDAVADRLFAALDR
jgi:glycosyltransferase involved in cell wall biosynthesis